MPRHLRSQTSKADQIEPPRRGVAVPAHHAGVLVLDARQTVLQTLDGAQDAVEQVHRLEAGDDDRHAIVGGERLVLAVAHDRAHVARPEKALHAVAGRLQHGGHGRRHEDVGDEHREVAHPQRAGARDGHARWRARSSRSRWRRTRPRGRGSPGRCARRRAANRRSARRRRWTSGAAGRCASPGTRSMSPNEVKITPGRAAMAWALSICSSGVTHTGQPGPCTSSICSGQQTVDAVLDDRVRLPAAHLHERPRAGRHPARSRARILAATRPSRYSSRYFMARRPGTSSSPSWPSSSRNR